MSTSRGATVVLRPAASPHDPGSFRLAHVMRRAGESVYGGALRALREAGLEGLEPWAVDLSAVRAVFACDLPDTADVSHLATDPVGELTNRVALVPRASVGFRSLTRADLPDVVRWVGEPHVARWWDDEAVDLAAAERHYGPAIDGTDPTRRWVIEVNGRSVGFVQDYRIADYPEFALLTAQPEAVGLDYAIGDPGWVGQGLGTRVLWQMLRDVLRPHHPEAPAVFAAPDHRNTGSLRVLDKLGFQRGLWFDELKSRGRVDTVVGCTLDLRRVLGRPSRLVTDR